MGLNGRQNCNKFSLSVSAILNLMVCLWVLLLYKDLCGISTSIVKAKQVGLTVSYLLIKSAISFLRMNLHGYLGKEQKRFHLIYWYNLLVVTGTNLFWEWLKVNESETHPVPLFLAGNTIWTPFKEWMPREHLKPLFGSTSCFSM